MTTKRATIEVYERGYKSKSKRSQGNRIVTQWKIVINVRPDEDGLVLDGFRRKDVRLLRGTRQFGADDILKWLESLAAEFEMSSGLTTEIRSKKDGLGE